VFGCLFMLSLCEGFRVFDWKRKLVFTFCVFYIWKGVEFSSLIKHVC
jgi:hypothetical protein